MPPPAVETSLWAAIALGAAGSAIALMLYFRYRTEDARLATVMLIAAVAWPINVTFRLVGAGKRAEGLMLVLGFIGLGLGIALLALVASAAVSALKGKSATPNPAREGTQLLGVQRKPRRRRGHR